MKKATRIEPGRDFTRRSPFDLKSKGLTPDPNKDYRWVDPNKIESRKHMDGYEFTKGGSSADGTHRTRGNMVLMERPRTLADESTREKRYRTDLQSGKVKTMFREEVETLSSKHGIDLHRAVEHIDHEK